jgi:hypothetical protein
MIKPTVGRVVWFWPSKVSSNFGYHNSEQPCAALVAYVWSDTCVNLHVIDQNGNGHSQTSVPLVQDTETAPANGYYCEWMPYQIGQAKKEQTT